LEKGDKHEIIKNTALFHVTCCLGSRSFNLIYLVKKRNIYSNLNIFHSTHLGKYQVFNRKVVFKKSSL